jgi:CII-binding regulator of phage lambda lysogenization HflD
VDTDELIMQALGRLENSVVRLESSINEIHKDIASLGARIAALETHWDDFDKMKGVLIAAIASPVAVFLIKAVTDIFQRT